MDTFAAMLRGTNKLKWHKLHDCCYTATLLLCNILKQRRLSVCCMLWVSWKQVNEQEGEPRGNLSCNSQHDLISLRISATEKGQRWVLLTLWSSILSPVSKIILFSFPDFSCQSKPHILFGGWWQKQVWLSLTPLKIRERDDSCVAFCFLFLGNFFLYVPLLVWVR